MNVIIYLDQNILSDLRTRRLDESGDKRLLLLRAVLLDQQIHTVYSHVHLAEIAQIPVEKYRHEHIELLEELSAKYIEPLTNNLIDRKPDLVWSDYLENEIEKSEMGITDVVRRSELSSRKLSGLPIEDSFEDIGNGLKASLQTLLDNCEKQLGTIDIEKLEEPHRSYFIEMQANLPTLRAKCQNMETIAISENHQLGPAPFRECSEIRRLEVMRLPSHEVVRSIEATFAQENSDFSWREYFEDTPQGNIARAYSLMNWAGYYADDFDKVKKGRDRFKASSNDMLHAIMAYSSGFLISKDEAFLKKARACYEYIGAGPLVRSPKKFLENHCKLV